MALQESEEPFRSLSASSPIGIFLTDTAGRCIYTNPRCQAICGFSFDEGLGLGWERFVYLEDREAKAWAACTRKGREYSGEFRFQTPQGGMQERISWLGGRCTVHSRPGAGTRIVGEIPLPRPSGGAPNGG